MKVLISTIDTKTHEVDLVVTNLTEKVINKRFEDYKCLSYCDSVGRNGQEIYALYEKESKIVTVVAKSRQI